jgi:hypothetical protein
VLYSQANNLDLDSMSVKLKHQNLVCNYCHKKGHVKFGCLRLKNKGKRKQKLLAEVSFCIVDKESLLYIIDDKVSLNMSGFCIQDPVIILVLIGIGSLRMNLLIIEFI